MSFKYPKSRSDEDWCYILLYCSDGTFHIGAQFRSYRLADVIQNFLFFVYLDKDIIKIISSPVPADTSYDIYYFNEEPEL